MKVTLHVVSVFVGGLRCFSKLAFSVKAIKTAWFIFFNALTDHFQPIHFFKWLAPPTTWETRRLLLSEVAFQYIIISYIFSSRIAFT